MDSKDQQELHEAYERFKSFRDSTRQSKGIQAVIDAWNDKGPHPLYHVAAQEQLRAHWPALASALDNLTKEQS